ncbi:MAG: 5-formyltetrahydrofolate cyclo-ligase [Coriobacteriales bacterium]|nr:5-formyltetrahydrofolate cyclo-ligase [Coriobacteriales bacterium]
MAIGDTGLPQAKAALRKHCRERRDNMGRTQRAAIDARITACVSGLAQFAQADLVLSYASIGSEVSTYDLIATAWESGKVVALPRCHMTDHTMAWHRVDSLKHLLRSSFGVPEPPDNPTTLVNPRDALSPLALVPGLAFDRLGMRIGYGGGFYDRFLQGFDGCSVGLCREELVMDDLRALGVVEPHDVPVSLVVTEFARVQ